MQDALQVATKPDAGPRSFEHYKHRLPAWRYKLRQQILPLVRWETPYLAWLQETMRSSTLDSYFAITANLGTHTFFMILLPALFWYGHPGFGRGMVNILTSGVYFSGFVKDMLCLPRPLSPPLQRISMSGSAALEYGFPSTHSTNAVSVATYAIFILMKDESASWSNTLFQVVLYWYACSIVLGRLYCGMHGFLDVIIGSLLGCAIALFQCFFGETFESWFIESESLKPALIIVLTILVLVRIHPEPADDCPCFDDSVACAGVVSGVVLGSWHFHQSGYAWSVPSPATAPFDLGAMGWPKTILRMVLGVFVVFAWREVMKPTLLRYLPPLFRVIESLGLSLPRKFFINASQYKKVPRLLKDHEVIPSIVELPSLLRSIRNPRRRAVSVGPQSEADAYETLAYREKRRRDSLSANQAPSANASKLSPIRTEANPFDDTSQVLDGEELPSDSLAKTTSRLSEYEDMMGTGLDSIPNSNRNSTIASETPTPSVTFDAKALASDAPSRREQGEKEMFERLQRPRVRYDVEVVTKLIVYAGIGWLAVEINPLLFELVGLGMNWQGPQGR